MKKMSKLVLLTSLYLIFSPLGLANDPPAVSADEGLTESGELDESPPEESSSVLDDYRVVVSEGERIEIDDGLFSIETPTGWNIHLGHPSLALLMQVQKEPGMKYQRTIQIASFSDAKYIDDLTKQYFEELIVRRFSQASASVEDFRIRNSMIIQMDDGRDGLLFYSEFLLEGVPLMQAHILVSSSERHFLMTFTDLAEHFEGAQAANYLNTAWASMTSIQVNGATPVRYSEIKTVGMIAGGLIFLVIGFSFFSRKRAGKKYENFEKGINVDDDDELQESELQTINQEMVIGSMHADELDAGDDSQTDEESLAKSKEVSEIEDDDFDDVAV